MSKTLTLMLFGALILSACGGEPEDTRPGQPVAHRRAAFKEILKVSEPMGVMLRDDTYEAKRFGALAGQLMTLRDSPWSHFAPDTQYPPSHAKDEVWKNPEQFAADKRAFIEATDRLAAIGSTADKKQAAATYKLLEDACRNCHKHFKRD